MAAKNKNDKAKAGGDNLLPVLLVVLIAALLYFTRDSVITATGIAEGAGRPNVPIDVPAAMEDPRQEDLHTSGSISLNGYTLQKVAAYSMSARILSSSKYYMGREAQLSPVDLALGWGMMADKRILKSINITQVGRMYAWDTDDFPIPREQIESSSANVHIIPANAAVEKTIKGLRHNQIVTMKGYLVNAVGADGWTWKTSISRLDTGTGSCELFYVESVTVH